MVRPTVYMHCLHIDTEALQNVCSIFTLGQNRSKIRRLLSLKADVAQLVEQRIRNAKVVRSIRIIGNE